MTEQDIEMYEINEEVVEVMDVQLTDEVDLMKCLICESIDQMGLQQLEKGIQSFIHQCQTLGRVDLIDFIESNKSKPLHVHKTCRQKWLKSYSKTTKRASTEEVGKLRSTRKSSVNCDLATTCFFCDQSVAASKAHDIRHVSTMTIDESIRHAIHLRSYDKWALEVLGRLEAINDLRAADAVYHALCYARFTNSLPHTPKKNKRGRPVNDDAVRAFDMLCEELEQVGENDLFTLNDLYEKMAVCCSNLGVDSQNMYTKDYLRLLLHKRYSDHIYFAQQPGREDVIGFRGFCDLVLRNQFLSDCNDGNDSEAERVVRKAAMLILAEIRETNHDHSYYPSTEDIKADGLSFLPNLLKLLVNNLIRDPMKQAGIGQAIVQATKPRSCIMPLIFGVGVQLERVGNRQLQDEFSKLGFCVSSHETRRFKHSVMATRSPSSVSSLDLSTDEGVFEPMSFTQYVADNFDHNIRTLDGNGTLHGMGVISSTVRPESWFGNVVSRIRRIEPSSSIRSLIERCMQIVKFENKGGNQLENLILNPLHSLFRPISLPATLNVSNLWNSAGLSSASLHPNWSGYMQQACDGLHTGTAAIDMLTIFDLNPSDENCIYSTLIFVSDQAKALRLPDVSITFDQPLFIKAVDIAGKAKLDVVVRLGGFHLLMNYLGSIGKVMKGSGLEEVMGEMYGSNTIEHIMSGKAYARALRGHLLVSSALTQILVEYLKNETDDDDVVECVILPAESASKLRGCLTADKVIELQTLFNQTFQGKSEDAQISFLDSHTLSNFTVKLEELITCLTLQSRTSQLWTSYLRYVDLVKTFLLAERTGNWLLHLDTVAKMLPLFAATGHVNYAKSARVYLQNMRELPSQHPWLFEQFQEGKATIRRSNRFWAGLSPDVVIEQTLMKCGKSQGGLTRGRGLHESMRVSWLSTLTDCASIHAAMTSVTKTERQVEEHVEVGLSRMRRDALDKGKVKRLLVESSPFRYSEDRRLISLSSGLAAGPEDDVNCEIAECVGHRLLKEWDGQCYGKVSLKRANVIKNLSDLNNKSSDKKAHSNIDASNLFHRLIIIGERTESVRDCFSYELTPYPMSLFKSSVMRKPDKPALCVNLISGLESAILPGNVFFVVDGGYLIHKVRWQAPVDMKDVLPLFTRYLEKFGSNVSVVFDGYEDGPSTKDHEHCRRAVKFSNVAPTREITCETKQIGAQDCFFANTKNKKSFIAALAKYLISFGVSVTLAKGDADTDIVQVALQRASQGNIPVAVVAQDTDILVLLLHHRNNTMTDVYFVAEPRRVRGGKTTDGKCVSIRLVQDRIGVRACQRLPVVHAMGGCDTTSAIFGHGKGTIYDCIAKDTYLHNDCMTLQSSTASADEVCNAGVRLMIGIYGGKPSDTLTSLRYAGYCSMSLSKRFQADKLPPSNDAARNHAKRVHYQALVWTTLGDTNVKATDWGWREDNGKLVPVHLEGSIAPEHMLKFVRCSCRSNCKSSLCSCRANGLHCVSACKHCHGSDCTNPYVETAFNAPTDSPEKHVPDEEYHMQTLPDFIMDDDLCLQFNYEEEF